MSDRLRIKSDQLPSALPAPSTARKRQRGGGWDGCGGKVRGAVGEVKAARAQKGNCVKYIVRPRHVHFFIWHLLPKTAPAAHLPNGTSPLSNRPSRL